MVVTVTQQEPSVMTQDWAVQMMVESSHELVPRILALNWTVEIDRRRTFITSDMPVHVWRRPSGRDTFRGIGLAVADEVRFPLDPGKQLVLSKRQRASTIEVAAHRVKHSNADLASACHRFILGHPANRAAVDRPTMYRTRPLIRFWTGPLFVPDENGVMVKAEGDVIQQWTPRVERPIERD